MGARMRRDLAVRIIGRANISSRIEHELVCKQRLTHAYSRNMHPPPSRKTHGGGQCAPRRSSLMLRCRRSGALSHQVHDPRVSPRASQKSRFGECLGCSRGGGGSTAIVGPATGAASNTGVQKIGLNFLPGNRGSAKSIAAVRNDNSPLSWSNVSYLGRLSLPATALSKLPYPGDRSRLCKALVASWPLSIRAHC